MAVSGHNFSVWGEITRPLAALDRSTLNKGAFAFKIVQGALKWPLKGGSRLIEVASTAGLTVLPHNLSDANNFSPRQQNWKLLAMTRGKGLIEKVYILVSLLINIHISVYPQQMLGQVCA